jgi:hypothetical protein
MNQKGNHGGRPVENEYRSSQMYRTLNGINLPGADKLAEGLGKAAAGIDAALHTVNAAAQNYQQNSQPPQTQQTYRYRYPQPGQPPRPPQPGPAPQPPRAPQPGPGVRQGHTAYTGPRAQPHRPPAGVTPAPAPQMPPMKVVHMGSPAKYYITGVAALLYALNAQMTEPAEFAVFGIVVLLVFLLSGALFRGKKQLAPVQAQEPKPQPQPEPQAKKEPEPEKKSATGNPEVDKIINEGHDMIKKLRAANDAIPDEALSADIDRMERASADIFNYIAKHPGKAPQIRKFMNYYLPTTLKLLGSYEQLSKQSVKGENITSTLFNIAGMMHTVADAFEKQLDSLFTDEAMDISADITVFETMLKQEGFVEEKKNGL